ncbi:HD domain-containing phosphohydrolase [Sulfurimonas sp.]
MSDKHSCNMTNSESYIRGAIAITLLYVAYELDSIVLALGALILFHSAVAKFCFMYHILHINEKFSSKNYYLSLLPKYTSTPVFIFNKDGELVFKNGSADKVLSFIHKISDFYSKDFQYIITKELDVIDYYSSSTETYQIELRGIAKEQFLLVYFFDVTKLVKLNKEIEETQREVIYAMGEIGETRSKETGHHVKRVALYSKRLALLAKLPKEEAEILQMASPMHDIGKVGIPDAILNAPRKLTQEEFEIMKTHAQLGYNMLKNSNKKILQAAAIVAGEHHEKYDGSGYPNNLKGEDIHIYGRITAIADVFDALGSHRIYKQAWELEKIINYFKNESAKHFDPKLVTLFLDNLDEFLLIKEEFKDEVQ